MHGGYTRDRGRFRLARPKQRAPLTMSTPAAVRRLQHDIHRLNRAEKARGQAQHALKHDRQELKHDKKHIEHVRDAFEHGKQELKGDRHELTKLRSTAEKALDGFEAKEAELQRELDASVDPLTGQPDLFLQARLSAVQQRHAEVKDQFEQRIDGKRDGIEKLEGSLQRQRAELDDTAKELKADRRDVKHSDQQLDRARDRVKDRRHDALEHLRPAEYEMGLKATNRARKELGLGSVDHVIRPDRGPGDVSGVSGAGLQGLTPKVAWAAKVARKMGLTVTSTTGGTHAPGSYHYSGRAVDVAGPPSVMAKFYRFMSHKNPTELFYDPLGGIKNGVQIGAIGGHSDHVHVAF